MLRDVQESTGEWQQKYPLYYSNNEAERFSVSVEKLAETRY